MDLKVGLFLIFIIAIWVVPYLFVWFFPVWVKRRHVKNQNRLLNQCRAIFVLAAKAVERKDEASARTFLKRIRRIESHWHYGNTTLYRVALMVFAVFTGGLIFFLMRFFILFGREIFVGKGFANLIHNDLTGFAAYVSVNFLIGAFFAHSSYRESWRDELLLDDCGDRLERLLDMGRDIVITSDEEKEKMKPPTDGLSPLEIFGLGTIFTQKELDRARRNLVKLLHPDLSHQTGQADTAVREEALKRVNAAYDELKPLVS